MCTEGNFIFLTTAKAGLQKQSASSFVVGCTLLFYINKIHPVDILHSHTKWEEMPQLNTAAAQVGRDSLRLGEQGLGSFCIIGIGRICSRFHTWVGLQGYRNPKVTSKAVWPWAGYTTSLSFCKVAS